MVHNPEIADQQLQYIIENSHHPRPFDYKMEPDIEWEQAQWYLKSLKKDSQ